MAPEGRVTLGDPGLWDDAQVAPLWALADAIRLGGATPAAQIGHARRKASTTVPWQGGSPKSDGRSLTADEGAWQAVGPSDEPYGGDKTHAPVALTEADLTGILTAFADAARRADAAGFDVLGLHGAHGYLLHSFYSPISNRRTDGWGGDFDGRIRLTLEVLRAVRAAWSYGKPLAFRLAMDDFHPGGWKPEDGVELARRAVAKGVDILDPMSFGGVADGGAPDWSRNFTAEHARLLKDAAPNAVVVASAQTAPGYDTDPAAIEALLADGTLDGVLMGRQLLADPNWPAKAATALGDDRLLLPANYEHWLTVREVAA